MRPNILIIMTDQERAPMHMENVNLETILPARNQIKNEGVSYENFYINASPCTPNRSVMLTGLYSQQIWMCTNPELGQPSLKTGFPSFARALKDIGYDTAYSGKWHISSEIDEGNPEALKDYGFDVFDPPMEFAGSPNEGENSDNDIAARAVDFINNRKQGDKPFLCVVSFVNPHDIMYYWRFMKPRNPGETYKGMRVPKNFESMNHLKRSKPKCQGICRTITNTFFGRLPNEIDSAKDKKKYIEFLDYYLWLQKKTDTQIQKVLHTLNAPGNAGLKENTVIIFTSDHGELAGSHGLRGKNFCFYEEAVRVPFYVTDYTGKLIPKNQAGTMRKNLGSSIDLFPTLLSIAASGGDPVDTAPYDFLPGTDLTPNLKDPSIPTNDYVLFAHDLVIPGMKAPAHIVGKIDEEWKGALYNNWQMDNLKNTDSSPDEAVQIVEGSTDRELYKRTAPKDRLEIENLANYKKNSEKMDEIESQLIELSKTQLRGPLPSPYNAVSEQAKADYVANQKKSILEKGPGKLKPTDLKFFD